MEPDGSPRVRAWLLNVLTRQCREQGEYKQAIEYSHEAITIAKGLGDQSLEALNAVNCGNSLREDEQDKEALAMYEYASFLGGSCKDVTIEAQATRLSAEVYFDLGDYGKSESYAQCAAALSKSSGNFHQLASSLQLLGDILFKTDELSAAEIYLEGAKAILGQDGAFNNSNNLAYSGLRTIVERQDFYRYFVEVDKLLDIESRCPVTETSDPLVTLNELVERVLPFLKHCRDLDIVRFVGLHTRLTLGGVPKLIARQASVCMITDIIKSKHIHDSRSEALLSISTILAMLESDSFRISDVVKLSTMLCDEVDGMWFKPYGDGASHWTIRMNFNNPVVITILQMDDNPDVSIACMMLVLCIKALENEIKEELIGAADIVCEEVEVCIADFTNVKENIPLIHDIIGEEFDAPCLVTRSEPLAGNVFAPIFVVCRDDILGEIKAGYGKGSGLQVLVGSVLLELMYQWFNGEIEEEVLRPKLVKVTHRTTS